MVAEEAFVCSVHITYAHGFALVKQKINNFYLCSCMCRNWILVYVALIYGYQSD